MQQVKMKTSDKLFKHPLILLLFQLEENNTTKKQNLLKSSQNKQRLD